MTSDKLTRSQVAQLGGFAAARNGDNATKGSKGGNKTYDKYGREHFVRAAHKKHGRLGGKGAAK